MFVDKRTSESLYNLSLLQERFGDQVMEPVPIRTRMREAIAEGETIFDYAPKDDIAILYESMCRTIETVPAKEKSYGQTSSQTELTPRRSHDHRNRHR